MEKRNMKTIKQKLTKIISLMVTIPVTVLGLWSIISLKKNNNDNFLEVSNTFVDASRSIIEKEILTCENVVDVISGEATQENDILKSQLQLIMKTSNNIINIYFAGEDKSVVQALNEKLPDGFDPTSREWYQNAKNQKGEYTIINPYIDEISKDHVVTISKAVVKDNNFIGVVAIDINLTSLSNQISGMKYREKGEVVVLSNNGDIIVHNNKEKIGTNEAALYSNWDNIIETKTSSDSFKYNGKRYSGYYTTEEITGWKIIMQVPTTYLITNEIKAFMLLGVILIIIMIITIVNCRKYSNYIASSINILKLGIQNCSNGKFNKEISIKSNDEFEKLAEDFNSMQKNISELITTVEKSAITVNDTAISLANMSEEVSASMVQVNDTVSEISRGTMESSGNLETVSHNMNDLSDEMNKIEEITNEISEMAVNTDALSQDGLGMVKSVIEQSQETKNRTNEVQYVVKEVAERIDKIGVMNEAIARITDQTNLLALNAAIEAARAGEAGKGFAVVADEIRKLAEETSQSAKEIDSIVRDVKEKSHLAVEKVLKTAETVEVQEEAVKSSEAIFDCIVASVGELSKGVNQMARGLSEVNKRKNHIVEQVENLSAVLEETAAGTEEVSASADEVTNATEQFTAYCGNLKNLSAHLKEQVETFEI